MQSASARSRSSSSLSSSRRRTTRSRSSRGSDCDDGGAIAGGARRASARRGARATRVLELGDHPGAVARARPTSGCAAISSTISSSAPPAPAERGAVAAGAGARRRRPRRAGAPRRTPMRLRRAAGEDVELVGIAGAQPLRAGASPRGRPPRDGRRRRGRGRRPRRSHASIERLGGLEQRGERGAAVRAHERVGIVAGGQEDAAAPEPGVDEGREAARGGAAAGGVAVEAGDDAFREAARARASWSTVSAVPSGATTSPMPACATAMTSR